jgi:acetyl-CoA carboxylase biotin carboxyl carrier protein
MSDPALLAASPSTRGLDDPRWQQIAGWLAGTDIEFAEISGPDGHVRMLRETGYLPQLEDSGQSLSAGKPPAACAGKVVAMASLAGIFLDRHPLRAAPLAQPGARVRQGEVMGLLQLGAVLAPVVAPAGGVVTRVLVPPGNLVGYGTALVEIDAVDDTESGAGEAPWK